MPHFCYLKSISSLKKKNILGTMCIILHIVYELSSLIHLGTERVSLITISASYFQ